MPPKVDNVKELKQQRASRRRAFTRVANKIQDIIVKDHPLQAEIENVEAALIGMDDTFKECKSLDLEIEGILLTIDEAEAAKDADDAIDTLMENQLKIVRARNFLSKMKSRPSTTASTVATSKLPKLTLPTFNGNLTEWTAFWERFQAEIDRNSQISDINKFDYLYGLLEGNALDSVRSIIPSSANYGILKKTLLENFGKNKKIIRAHVLRLVHLQEPPLSGQGLRSYYNQIQTDLRSLQTLNVDVDDAAAILVPILAEKLPSRIRGNIADIDRSDEYILKDFLNALKRQVERYETESEDIDLGEKRPVEVFQSTPMSTLGSFVGLTNGCTLCGSQQHKVDRCNLSLKQKKDMVMIKRLCKLCLVPNHISRRCNSSSRCGVCSGLHHTTLHGVDFRVVRPNKHPRGQRRRDNGHGGNSSTDPLPAVGTTSCSLVEQSVMSTSTDTSMDTSSKNVSSDTVTSVAVDKGPVVMVKTAKAVADYDGRQVPVRMFFDEGSQRSYLRQNVADELGVHPEGYVELGISGFHSSYSKDRYGVATIGIVTSDGVKCVPVLITEEIVSPINQRGWSSCIGLAHVQGLELADDYQDDKFVVDVLIGADCAWKFLQGDCVRGDGPTAHMSNVGALLIGPVNCESDIVTDNVSHCCFTQPVYVDSYDGLSNRELDNKLSTLFRSSELGVSDVTGDDVDEDFMADYRSRIEFRDGKYFVPLPWKDDHKELPSNLQLCRRRLEQILSRLQNENLLDAYCKVMQEHLDKGYIEEVKEDPWDEEHSHYLPHFYVLKDSETTPLRIVFAANAGRVALNDCLVTGPCMLRNLHDLLVKFRVCRIGIVADIARAFLSIGLIEEDRNYVKFLWFRNNDPTQDIVVYRYTTVVFGNTSSPFSLGIVLDHHLADGQSEVATDMGRKLYMDNLLTGVNDEIEAMNYYYSAREIMRDGGFNLRQWLSNSSDLSRVTQLEGTQTKSAIVSVLGMMWDAENDTLSLQKKNIVPIYTAKVTKRNVLSGAASIFDPLGLVSPVTLKTKLFISELWKEKYDWDNELPAEKAEDWRSMASDLENISDMTFPRWYGFDRQQPVQLHTFCDASLSALGTVAYLRQGDSVALLGSKSKIVGPKSKTTIPQLELSAMTLGAKYADTLVKAFETDYPHLSTYYWSDSEIGLHWLNSEKQLKRPTSTKVDAVKKLSNVSDWRHVRSGENPADLVSRGCDVRTLQSSRLWNSGPKWLTECETWKPWNSNLGSEALSAAAIEYNDETTPVKMPDISKVIDPKHFSSLERLLRVTVYVMRFSGLSSSRGDITVDEMNSAETLWVKSTQAMYHADALQYLKRGRKGSKCPAIVRQLNAVLDENGIIRGAGRLGKALFLDRNSRMPILLPRKCWFSKLVIRRAHEDVMHDGLGATVVAVRRKYWIPATRAEVGNTIRRCRCKRLTGSAYLLPPSPDLPEFRVDATKPFRNIGMDFTGHLYVKERSGQHRKVYVCLFTCLGTRCVNLELVSDLTADAFIQAFRRHCASYSVPDLCYSDNASNFKSGNEEIKRLLEIVASAEVQSHFTQKRVKFNYIPVQSPWWGGAWERLIGVMKSVIRRTLGNAFITYEQMLTLIKEVQSVMNNRPLTYASGNIDDLTPLTPSMLLFGHETNALPQHQFEPDPDFAISDKRSVSRAEKRRSQLYEHFVRRFQEEYLSSLRERHSHQVRKGNAGKDIVKVGDVVLVYEENMPRLRWRLGLVTGLIIGSDSRVRAAHVKTANRITTRAISRLYPLEINAKAFVDDLKTPTVENPPELRRSGRSTIGATRAKIARQLAG